MGALSIFDFALLPVLQVDQLSCNGERKLQPDRSQAIRERLRGKGLPTGKCLIAVGVMAINTALWKTKFGYVLWPKKLNSGGLADRIHRTLMVQCLAKCWWW